MTGKLSEAKRASNARWDSTNMAYQTVKVRRELLERFWAACAARGDRVNTVLREAMERYVQGQEAGTWRRDDIFFWECSHCKRLIYLEESPQHEEYNFCPICGGRMKID